MKGTGGWAVFSCSLRSRCVSGMTAILQLIFLIGIANVTPILAHGVCGRRWGRPIDGGVRFFDGRPLLGRSKTVRGVLTAILVTGFAAMALDLSFQLGVLIGGMAMLGDLSSSFIKRRLGLAPSSQAYGLDQVPESLLPALAAMPYLSLTLIEVMVVVALFFVAEVRLSPVLFRLGIRRRPY